MSVRASQKAFISHYIKLDFFNDSILDADVQDRISNESEIIFQKALENIQGDNKETQGVGLSELTLLSMAYFYERIFPEDVQTKSKDYTINSVKGFFDACNHTQYTAIYECDTTYHKLRETALFKACYLIIQSAWFFNSHHFGSHQYLQYSSHYIKTGEQLPVEAYQYDTGDLMRKYAKIDEVRNTKHHPKGEPAYKFVDQWYYYILYLVCKELELSTKHFKTTLKGCREYNPLTKCPRILRAETPFKVIECDIKSAFPSFLDLQTGSKIKDEVYANLMERKKISRSDSKVLFNSRLNSGKYKTKGQIKSFLIECGYTDDQAEKITYYTNGDKKFITYMSELEQEAIMDFKEINDLKKAVRLHDSVLFIDVGTTYLDLKAEDGLIEFGVNVLKNPVYTNNFNYSNKSLRFAYISSVPPATKEEYKNLIRKSILTKPRAIGEANGFKFFAEKYEYISASFDLNKKYTFDEFVYNCKEMIGTLNYLNKRPISKIQLFVFLCHIRQNSNIIFNVRYLFNELLKNLDHIDDINIRQRDFELTEQLTFRKKIDFLKALNMAKGKVNKEMRLKHILQLLKKRFSQNDFSFIDHKMNGKAKTNQIPKHIILRINKLCTGYARKPKAQTLNMYPLYSIIYKEGTNYLVEPIKYQNKNRIVQRKIQVYERELLRINRLINNRKIASQYIHILGELLGTIPETDIIRDEIIIKEEKKNIVDAIGAKTFKSLCKVTKVDKVKPITPTINDFDTSLEHSAFNIGIEEADQRGDQFFYEYLKFHNLNEASKEIKEVKKKKEKMIFPEIDFDSQ